MYCTVPKGPLGERASERAPFFSFGGEVFLLFFLDRVGELAAAAAEEKVFWFFLYLFLEGAFLVLLLLLGSTWLSSSFSLSFFPGRASLEEGLEE